MAVETADDLASFFDDEEFAESATWTPPGGGDPVPCIVIVDRGRGRSRPDVGRPGASVIDRRVIVRRWNPQEDGDPVEIVPVRDGVFLVIDPDTLVSEKLKVMGEPPLDHTARIFTCDVVVSTA